MRAMTQADIEAVLVVEQTVQHYPWTRGNLRDALENNYLCRVDEADGQIRGYAILMPVVDEAELLTLGVAAAQQRKGVGRAILEDMLQLAREKAMRRVFLEVRDSNSAAVNLYKSAGFKEVGVRRAYYQSASARADALVMACDLTDEING
jgi:ribosomal-protein-alanine N-acetyltransferase